MFPIDLLFTVKGSLEPLTDIEKRMDSLGMRLRLTGRDLMRLGGAMDRFFSMIISKVGNVLQGSLLWETGLEDIRWALEDVGSVLGDILAPGLETIADLIESFADALERSPTLQFLVTMGLLAIVIFKALGMLLKFVGAMNLYTGTLLVAARAHLGLGATLKALWIGYWQGTEQMLAYIATQKGLLAKEQVLGKQFKETRRFQDWLFEGYENIQPVAQSAFGRRMQGTVSSFTSKMGSLWKGFKGGLKTILKVGGAIGAFGLIAMAMPDLLEPLEDLFAAIGKALEPITDFLVGIIQGLTDWIEENPELAKDLILLFTTIGVLLIALEKLGVMSRLGGWLANKLGLGLEAVTSPMKTLTKNTWMNTFAQAALVAAVAALVAALTYFFTSLASTGVGVWEAVGALAAALGAVLAFIAGLSLVAQSLGTVSSQVLMGIAALAALVGIVILLTFALSQLLPPLMALPGGLGALWATIGAILALTAGLAAIAIVLGVFAPLALLGAVVMGILALAALGLGAAILLAGAGMQLAADALGKLVAQLPGLTALVPVILGLAAGITLLGLGSVTLAAGLVALSAGVLLLAAALTALTIPLGVLRLLGGEAAVVEALRHLPTLQFGGVVEKTGIAVVHEGETVIPPGAGGSQVYNNFYISATIREEADIYKLAKEINRLQKTEVGRTR